MTILTSHFQSRFSQDSRSFISPQWCIRFHSLIHASMCFLLLSTLSTSLLANTDSSPHIATLPGDFTVGSTGAAQYSIPIEIPEGTAGVQPQLSLNYSSQAGQGILGQGWSIGGLSMITRCPTTLEQDGFIDGVDFDDNDRFCLDGQRLIVIQGQYGADGTEYRTEIDGFSQIHSYDSDGINGPDYFIVKTKAGETMEYGNTADSRFNSPNANGQKQDEAFSWALNKVTDTMSSYFLLEYREDDTTGEHYIEKIRYTGNDKTHLQPYNEIIFEYENRADARSLYTADKKISVTKKLQFLDIKSNNNLLVRYKFKYQTEGEKGSSGISSPAFFTGIKAFSIQRTLLYSIDRCDADDVCQLATSFTYEKNDEGWEKLESHEPPVPFINHDYKDFGVRFIDVNGDGRNDIIKAFVLSNRRVSTVYSPVGTGENQLYKLEFTYHSIFHIQVLRNAAF